MFGWRLILAIVPLIALGVAQNPRIAFTTVPAVVTAGSPVKISWGGGDGSPVTLTLRQGDPNNLDTVETIVDSASGYSYTWTVSPDLPSASDYALQITQGQSDINYSGVFAIVGGSGSSSISTTGTGSSSATASANATTRATGSITSTGLASMGTGTSMSRNVTFSSASLSSASRTVTFGDSTSTDSAETATSTSEASSTSAPNSNAATHMGSSAALVMGIIAAVMCIN